MGEGEGGAEEMPLRFFSLPYGGGGMFIVWIEEFFQI